MTTRATHRPGIEMTDDPAFVPRLRRLTRVSVVGLGMTWALAVKTVEAPLTVDAILFSGWISMPLVLSRSIARPSVRRAVAVPATLVTVGLLAISASYPPASGPAHVGWLILTAGILFGGVLGVWFWYRWFPVPASLDDPSSPARWTLIGIHVAAVGTGLALIAIDAIS